MLVAGAAVSMIAPIGAQASNINLEDMSSYTSSSKSKGFNNTFSTIQPSDWAFKAIKDLAQSRGCNVSIPNKAISRFEAASLLNSCLGNVAEVTTTERNLIDEFSSELATIKGRVDGLEAKFNEFEAAGFSDTTTLTGSAVMAIGAVDGGDELGDTETTQTLYTYTMDLNTSFTGDDNLYVRLRSGSSGASIGNKPMVYHPDRYSGTTDVLAVDKIWYQFPIGDSTTAWIGPKIENYYMYAATPSIYKPGSQKAFKLGGLSAAFGASTSTGVGVKYQVGDSPWAFSTNIVSKGAKGSSEGFLSEGDTSKWDTMVAYTKPQWHASLTFSNQHNGWNSFCYYATSKACDIDNSGDNTNPSHDGKGKPNGNAYAFRTYWRPAESGTITPEVTIGYDVLNVNNNGQTKFKEASSYMIGLGWSDMFRADDKIGAAYGAPLRAWKNTDGSDPADVDASMWEIYYSFKPNDSITVIPAVFGGSDVFADSEDDIFGVMVTSKFKF